MKTTTEISLPTAAELEEKFGDQVSEAITFIQNFSEKIGPKYPQRPIKPFLNNKHSAAEVRAHADKLDIFEAEMKEYNAAKEINREFHGKVNGIIEEYMREVSGLNRIVPKEKRDKVYSKAYSDGHSSGYYEVYINLCELVDLFV
jgi:hypothetical protein